MATTEIFYVGDGTTTLYTFPFEYITKDDVKVSLDDVNTIAYTYANATTIQMNSAPAVDVQLRIFRETNIDNLKATFFSGSAIRAQDLNDNFQQNNFAVEEIRNYTWDNEVDTIHSDETWVSSDTQIATTKAMDQRFQDEATETIESNESWVSDDDHIATTAAIDARFQDELGETIESTETWVSDDDHIATTQALDNRFVDQLNNETIAGVKTFSSSPIVPTTPSGGTAATNKTYVDTEINDKIDDAIENDILINSTGLTKVTGGGQITLGIGAGSVDLDRIKADDVRTLAEQNANPNQAGSDDEIATTAALNKRHDIIYQSGTPAGNDWFVGKMWYDHTNDQTLSIWNGLNWLGISSGGTFITQPTVIWVDSVNGDDGNDGHRIIDAMKTIKAAVASANNGDIVFVNPGIYRETAPIDITVNNLSIVGQSIRSCFVHPTPATETESLFRVNSGTLLSNFSFAGIKASGTRGGHPVDDDPVYGLPTNQGWLASFYPNAVIYKSPYIQNCTNFSDSAIPNWTEAEYNDQVTYPLATAYFDPNNVTQGGFGGDLTSGPTGGGLFIDGAVPAVNSPLRSMVVDSFTQITLDGPGCLCANNGYAQLVSFFGTFAHYHAKALKGGQLNLSNCTTDFGRYGLIADGKSPTAVFTASVSANAAAADITFTIGAPTADPTWFGAATKPQDSMLVQIGSDIYPILSSVANGSGWDVTVLNPNPTKLSENLGLTNPITAGDTASFYQRSFVSTGGHTFEYVGSGTDYTALPENGGTADETKQAISLNNGKVWQSSTDHNGVFKVGDTFKVDQRSGTVEISLDAYRPEIINDLTPQLGGDLDVNGFDIIASSGNVTINGLAYPSVDGGLDHVLTTDGNGTLAFQSVASITGAGLQNVVDDPTPELGGQLDASNNKIVNLSDPTANQDAATKAYVDNNAGSVVTDGGNFDNGSSTISTSQTLDGGSF
jgi:hypothetical protein